MPFVCGHASQQQLHILEDVAKRLSITTPARGVCNARKQQSVRGARCCNALSQRGPARWTCKCTLQLLHLLLAASNFNIGALALVIDGLQPRAVLAEGRLHLQLLLDGRVGQLRPVALHLRGRAERSLQPPRRVLHLLQLALQPLKLRLALIRRHPSGMQFCDSNTELSCWRHTTYTVISATLYNSSKLSWKGSTGEDNLSRIQDKPWADMSVAGNVLHGQPVVSTASRQKPLERRRRRAHLAKLGLEGAKLSLGNGLLVGQRVQLGAGQ